MAPASPALRCTRRTASTWSISASGSGAGSLPRTNCASVRVQSCATGPDSPCPSWSIPAKFPAARNTRSGLGAWQIGARFSYVNLNDKAVQGGLIYDWTFGLNWFLNPNVKFQANYIVEHREGPTGTPVGLINGFGLRAAFDF